MHILYLHGYRAQPPADKLARLQVLGHRTTAPHLHYDDGPVFDSLLTLVAFHNARGPGIDFIIGSSMGGYMAYYLSDLLQLPCWLINPALRDDLPKLQPVPLAPKPHKAKYILLGLQDDVVPPLATIQHLAQRPDAFRTLSLRADLGHRIDATTFAHEAQAVLRQHSTYEKRKMRSEE